MLTQHTLFFTINQFITQYHFIYRFCYVKLALTEN